MRPTTLVISNIAWDFIWQRHQSLASLFARDSDVVFCEIPGIRRVGLGDLARIWHRLRTVSSAASPRTPTPQGVRVVRPFVVPATNPLAHAFNARRVERLLRAEPALREVDVVLNYSPSRTAWQLIERVRCRRLIYDCTDNWLAVRGIPACLPADEEAILRRADLTLVPSRALEALKRPFARRLERLPHGAFVERFEVEAKPPAGAGRRTVLYYGHLHAQHLDFAAIEQIARANPAGRVLLIGPAKTPQAFPPNVELPGQQPHERLREFIQQADVLLLPYTLNEYTRSVLPAKTYECLATGRPIVATPLPELVQDFSSWLGFAARPEEWPAAIERALGQHSEAGRRAQIELARANTWEMRYERLKEMLGVPATVTVNR